MGIGGAAFEEVDPVDNGFDGAAAVDEDVAGVVLEEAADGVNDAPGFSMRTILPSFTSYSSVCNPSTQLQSDLKRKGTN